MAHLSRGRVEMIRTLIALVIGEVRHTPLVLPDLPQIEHRIAETRSRAAEARQPHKLEAGGSNPPSATTERLRPKLLALPTTQETVLELKRRLGKELYRIEMDLQGGARIAGKPCDCLSRAKHLGGVEATAEELMSYEPNPVFGQVVDWLNAHEKEFEPGEIAKREADYYRGLAPQVRAFRKEVMGTEHLGALLNETEKAEVLRRAQARLKEMGGQAQ